MKKTLLLSFASLTRFSRGWVYGLLVLPAGMLFLRALIVRNRRRREMVLRRVSPSVLLRTERGVILSLAPHPPLSHDERHGVTEKQREKAFGGAQASTRPVASGGTRV